MDSEPEKPRSERPPVIPERILSVPAQDRIDELASEGDFRLLSAEAGLHMRAFNLELEFEHSRGEKRVEEEPRLVSSLVDLLFADDAEVRRDSVTLVWFLGPASTDTG